MCEEIPLNALESLKVTRRIFLQGDEASDPDWIKKEIKDQTFALFEGFLPEVLSRIKQFFEKTNEIASFFKPG